MRRNTHCIGFFITKQIKKPRLCSVLFLRESTQKVEKNSRLRLVFQFSCTSFLFYRFLCALQQNKAQSKLLYLLLRTRLISNVDPEH